MNRYIIATAATALALPLASPATAQSDPMEGGYHYQSAIRLYASYSRNPRTLDPDGSKFDQTWQELNAANADEPNNGNVYFWLGVLSEPDVSSATKCYNTALLFLKPGVKSNYALCATALASHLLDAGNRQKAKELMDKVAKSKHAARHTMIGNYCMDSRVADYAQAAKCYRTAIGEEKPGSPNLDELYARLIVAQTIAGDVSGARSTAAEAATKVNSGSLWRQAQAHMLYRNGKPDEALTTALGLFNLDRRGDFSIFSDCMALVCQIVSDEGPDAMAAIRSFKLDQNVVNFASSALLTSYPAAYVDLCQDDAAEMDGAYLANAYEKLFINAKALALNLEKEREKDAGDHNTLAYLRARMGDNDGAAAEMDSAVMMARAESWPYASYANLLTSYSDRYDDALAYADTALALNPLDAHAAFSRMWVLHVVKGDAEGAKAAAKRLLDIVRENEAEAAAQEDGSHMDLYGDIDVFNSALAKERKKVSDHNPWAYLVLGDKDATLAAVEDMLNTDNDLGSNSDPMYRHLFAAEIYALLGMTDNAVTHMAKALEHGYRDFAFLDHTPNLASLRTNRDFFSLMEKYRAIYRQEIEKYSK